MPTDLNFGRSIVEAYAQGERERLAKRQFDEEKVQNTLRNQQAQERLKQEEKRLADEAAYRKQQMSIAQSLDAMHRLELRNKAVELFLEKGITPAGGKYTPGEEVRSPVSFEMVPPDTGTLTLPPLPGERLSDNQPITIPSPQKYAYDTAKRMDTLLEPARKTEALKQEAIGARTLQEKILQMQIEAAKQENQFAHQDQLLNKRIDANKTLEEYRQSQANKRANLRVGGGKSDTQTRLLATAHDNNPLTKQAVEAAIQLKFIEKMSDKNATPSDDQGLFYSFAKMMDPNSTVREGEYKNVQDYSQALSQKFGIGLDRIFNNSGLLTPEARKLIKDTMRKRFSAINEEYKTYRENITGRIKKAGGSEDYLGVSPTDFINKQVLPDKVKVQIPGHEPMEIRRDRLEEFKHDNPNGKVFE